ncbi:MAG: hypothetical protein P4M15_10435 [Alphaproteobacteria bacterium]|nr:hypothetical protein [Alphaproteobacteria bacterium]
MDIKLFLDKEPAAIANNPFKVLRALFAETQARATVPLRRLRYAWWRRNKHQILAVRSEFREMQRDIAEAAAVKAAIEEKIKASWREGRPDSSQNLKRIEMRQTLDNRIVTLKETLIGQLQEALPPTIYREFDRAFAEFAEARQEPDPAQARNIEQDARWHLQQAQRASGIRLAIIPL